MKSLRVVGKGDTPTSRINDIKSTVKCLWVTVLRHFVMCVGSGRKCRNLTSRV